MGTIRWVTLLAHIAHLEGHVVGELILYGQVPLLRHRRLHRGRPDAKVCARKRIADGRLPPGPCWVMYVGLLYDSVDLWRTERKVLRKPQVGASALQVRRDGVCPTYNHLPIVLRRRPCEAEARLPGRPSVDRVVEGAAVAVLTPANSSCPLTSPKLD